MYTQRELLKLHCYTYWVASTLNPTSALYQLPSSDRHTETVNDNKFIIEEKTDGVSQKSSVTMWRLLEHGGLILRRAVICAKTRRWLQTSILSTPIVWWIEEKRCTVTWTKTERGLQTSSVNRWRLVADCKVYWKEKLRRRPKEDHRRLASTGDVWWWIVKYIERRCYLVEDRKRTADV